VELTGAEEWIRAHVDPVGPVETTHERPWSTALRVPIAGGVVWFKACGPVQAFEPRLEAELSTRHPELVAEVLASDEERAWLLLADAGTPISASGGNPPETWLAVLPRYAELQRVEAAHTNDHLAHGVPDLRVSTLPGRYDELLQRELPLEPEEVGRLRAFAGRLTELCGELEGHDLPDTIQHDDLHMNNVYEQDGTLRVLDWGDSSISHPFMSLVVTFRFLEEVTGLSPDDPWFARLRDAYLEPWGGGLEGVFALAMRIGIFAHAIAWLRQRDHLPEEEHAEFDRWFAVILRRAIAQTAGG
jgi:hypothetical protein